MVADFVAERGGGLLVARRPIVRAARPGRHAARRGAAGGAERPARRPGARRARPAATCRRTTPDADAGRRDASDHAASAARPTKRASCGRRCRRWPPAPPVGGPRPGATVLAVTSAPGGGVFPVVAVQRYGRGRSMMFAGEASWRWKMMVRLDRSQLRVLLAAGGALAVGSGARSGGDHACPRRPSPATR